MKHGIRLVASADADLDYYGAHEQRVILDGILKYLEVDADVETNRRKQLRPNPVGPWVLRLGDYRVFYEVTPAGMVRVLAIGHKAHNELFIRGRRIEI